MTKKTYLIIKLLIAIIAMLFSAYFVLTINKLNILPTKYFILLISIMLGISVINVLFFIPRKRILNIIGYAITIVIIIIACIGSKHVLNINSFFERGFGNSTTEITGYDMMVLAASDYHSLDDLEGSTVGYTIVGENAEGIAFINGIKDKIFAEFVKYDDALQLYDALNDGEIDAILISEGALQFLEAADHDVNKKIKSLQYYELTTEIDNDDDPVLDLRPINILISGSDSRSGIITAKSNSDVNMIVTLDPKNHRILLTSIPRDYYVQLHGTTGVKDKLTHSGIYGINMTEKTIEDLFDIDIKYTLKVGFQTVIEVVDLIGGIDIYSDLDFYSRSSDGGAIRTHVVEGMNHFNGAQALSYARERYAFKTGDNQRIQNQQQVIMAILDKVIQDKSILKKYDRLLATLSDLYRTDIPMEYVKLLVKNQLNTMKSWKIDRQVVTGSGASEQTYSYPGTNLWVMVPNMNSVKAASEKINAIIRGK